MGNDTDHDDLDSTGDARSLRLKRALYAAAIGLGLVACLVVGLFLGRG